MRLDGYIGWQPSGYYARADRGLTMSEKLPFRIMFITTAPEQIQNKGKRFSNNKAISIFLAKILGKYYLINKKPVANSCLHRKS